MSGPKRTFLQLDNRIQFRLSKIKTRNFLIAEISDKKKDEKDTH